MPYPLTTLVPLKTLEAAIRTASIDAAAFELGVTDRAVAISIRKLSVDVGTELCTISRDRVEATAAGRRLADAYQRAKTILNDAVADVYDDDAVLPVVCLQSNLAETFLGRQIFRLVGEEKVSFHAEAGNLDEPGWEIAVACEPVKQPMVHNHLVTKLKISIVSKDIALIRSKISIHDAKRVVVIAGTPWQAWLTGQGLSHLSDRVTEIEYHDHIAEHLRKDGDIAIIVRAFVHDQLDRGALEEASWTSQSPVHLDLYYARSLRKSFSTESRNLLIKVRSAAIKANLT